ncbi:MAG: hypothetical protein ACXWCG_12970 [Flavitalea sp.]
MKQKKLFSFLFIAVMPVVIICCMQQEEKKENEVKANTEAETTKQSEQNPIDAKLLTGNWIRTDAEYRIEISNLADDGKMKAGYFNPTSINVSQAQWKSEGGILKIYIELRDQNYPGSNYKLTYLKDKDILSGEYYQAVERNIYKVEFARAK